MNAAEIQSSLSTSGQRGQPTLIVVLGMHRSATSATTRAMETMGASLGDHLMPPAPDNAKGLFEDLDINALNIQLKHAVGLDWDASPPPDFSRLSPAQRERFQLCGLRLLRDKCKSGIFALKDPRIARLMPFWQPLFDRLEVRVLYVLPFRHPLSVMRSLEKRDKLDAGKSCLLSLSHVVAALRSTEGRPRALLDCDRLMDAPRDELTRLGGTLGVELDEQCVNTFVRDFLEKSLRHSRFSVVDLDLVHSVPPIVKDLFEALLRFSNEATSANEKNCQDVLAKAEDFLRNAESFSRYGWSVEGELRQLHPQLAAAQHRVDEATTRADALTLQNLQQEETIRSMQHRLDEATTRADALTSQNLQQEDTIRAHREQLAVKDTVIADLLLERAAIQTSTSWRVMQRVIALVSHIPTGARRQLRRALKVAWWAVTPWRMPARFRLLRQHRRSASTARLEPDEPDTNCWHIVPHYVDPRLDAQPPQCPDRLSVAVHLHLFYDDVLEGLAGRLANMPCPFDLYVSVPEERDHEHIAELLRTRLPRLSKLVVEQVPNRGRDLAPLIVQFGERLSHYAIVGHFYTPNAPHKKDLSKWYRRLLDHLLGAEQSTGGRIAHFFALLRSEANIIYPEGRAEFLKDETGWADNREVGRGILERYTNLSIEKFHRVEFPEDGMFWARGACLREFLNLPLSFDDFPEEPVAVDGTLADALKRLILIFAGGWEGQFLRLHRGDSIQDYRAYEERQDFSGSIVHQGVKVLAYYLPQFHPIPENDEWHGKGFTEWTKVLAANPLFEGHYQQHIPHPDIDYYLLDSAETLRKQGDLMRTAGVHGMVFYHYWFGGRMILERPARMLLETPDIGMPYCLCWANENWTRRWDGNESEILLAQNYSPEDARAFIRYLIPFFQDPRYLCIEGRPVLFVYRPSSIPDTGAYVDAWAEECRAAGLQAPYLVAVLTRGAAHPGEFGMDAGVERVLHDWTDGGAPEIKATLRPYGPINGRVLSYDDVAGFYSAQTDAKDFTYFRSLIPMWDTTARYGSDAYVVHGSTPERFQEWLESVIRYSERNLRADRRFVLVNAWNEWAEGAHLEPDTRYGYAYLNAVGRALSSVPYSSQLNPGDIQVEGTRIHLALPPHFRKLLVEDTVQAQRFFHMLSRSSIFGRCVVTIDADIYDQFPLSATAGKPEDAELVLEFLKPAFFGPRVIEKMVQIAIVHRESVIVPNVHQGNSRLMHVTASGAIRPTDAYQAPLVLYPGLMLEKGFRKFRMRTDAQCFVAEPNTEAADRLPVVTTIVRIHKSADFELLRNALCCLVAMRNCICVPLIAAQDLSREQSQVLATLLDDLPWYPGHAPKVDHYRSADGQGDLRSRMLNESLRKVETRYAAFLDYDDLLMPHAYEWLIGRLRLTGKAVAFGRVFSTTYSNVTGLRLERSRMYEYGYSYDEFIEHNHAPLHSFLIDMSRIDLANSVYYDDQRYMEDWLLTMQIFTRDNCDWDSLNQNFYIGEYVHSIDRPHTLALASDSERRAILSNPKYMLCEKRVSEMRLRLKKSR